MTQEVIQNRFQTKILVVGESCQDIFCYTGCARLAPEAPVPVVVPQQTITNYGMAMNVQRNILALGEKCAIVTNPNWKEVTKTRYIYKNTNQMFIRVDQNDDQIDRCNTADMVLEDYDIVVISDYCKGFLTTEDINYIASNHDCVFLDTKKKLGAWCAPVKYIKINNYEHERTADTLPESLREKLIIAPGSRGCQYRDKVYEVESVDIKDVSGAGDTFLSGLVVKYLETQNIEESLKFANECATTVVQKKGVSTV